MGNKLCKKKSDVVDNPKSPTPFDRIITRLHLRPNSWKSDSHLNQKQVNRCAINPTESNNIHKVHPLSKSSDWTDVELEVPEKDEVIHLRNPKLSLIFDNENSTPQPPPRKHKKGFREKIEAVAKSSLQAFQQKKPVEEPLCVKKTVKHTCPLDDHDCAIHDRNHKHAKSAPKDKKQDRLKSIEAQVKLTKQEAKRRKNLSVVSLPNYSELKLTVAHFDDIDNEKKAEEPSNGSLGSLPNDQKKLVLSTGKLETCMTRCRSFGSLLPQQILGKLRVRKIPTDVESDDSFGGLEDWDLRIIEHYNPKEASLPRPRKLPKDTLSDIEGLIVKDDLEKPAVPARRSESLVKKINREASASAVGNRLPLKDNTSSMVTPPPSPEQKQETQETFIPADKLPVMENGVVEHSSLMKILEEFSIKDKQRENGTKSKMVVATVASSPGKEFQTKLASVEDFLNKEKLSNCNDAKYMKLTNMEAVHT